MTPNVDHLPLMNKVEVFEHSLEHTQVRLEVSITY